MKKGFTLTEILITLGIIGIVSILTVPNFTRGMYKKNMIATLKSTYSQLVDAMQNKMADEGVYEWYDVLPDSDDELPAFAQSFLTDYLDVAKVCQTYDECFPSVYTHPVTGNTVSLADTFKVGNSVILTNKSTILFDINRPLVQGRDLYFDVYIDVNGKSAPNKHGIDYFLLTITHNDVTSTAMKCGTDVGTCSYGTFACCFEIVKNTNWEPLKF